jgi:hypothetical protein
MPLKWARQREFHVDYLMAKVAIILDNKGLLGSPPLKI